MLNQEILEYFARHLEEISKSRSGRGIYFCFDTVLNGEEGYRLMVDLFTKNGKKPATSSGLDKRDFNIVFDTRKDRDAAYDTMVPEITAFNAAHPNLVGDGAGTNEVSDPGGEVKKQRNWILYVVVGAVAVLLLLMLWNRKKK